MEVPAKTSSKSPKPLLLLLGSSPESCSVQFPGTRVSLPVPATCLLCASYGGCQNPRSAAPRASAVKRSEKAATLGSGPQEGDTVQTRGRTCDVLVLLKGQHLFLPPGPLQTHSHSRSPFRTDLTTASEGSKCGVPRLSKSRLQLKRPGARVFPGWRSCH